MKTELIRINCFQAQCPKLLSATFLIFGLTTSHSSAQDVENSQLGATSQLGASISLDYLENPQQLNDSDENELLSTYGANANYVNETLQFITSFNYRATKYDYKNDLLADRNIVDGTGAFTWKISPDIFRWSLSNSRSNQIIDFGEQDNPDNRQVVDVSSTGPSINLPFGGINMINVTLDHSISNYEQTSSLEQSRNTVYLRFTRIIGRGVTASFSSSMSDSKFDKGFGLDYEAINYSINTVLTRANYTASLEIGESSIERMASVKQRNPVVIASGSITINSQSTLNLNYSRTVQDALDSIRNRPVQTDLEFIESDGFEARLDSSNNANVFESISQEVGYTYQKPSSYSLRLGYGSRSRSYLGFNSEEEDKGLTFNLGFPLGVRTNVFLNTRFSELKSSRVATTRERKEYGVSASYSISDNLDLRFNLRVSDQTSGLITEQYDSSGAALGLTYSR